MQGAGCVQLTGGPCLRMCAMRPSTTSTPPMLCEYSPPPRLFFFLLFLLPPHLPPSEPSVDPLSRHYLPLLVTLNLK